MAIAPRRAASGLGIQRGARHRRSRAAGRRGRQRRSLRVSPQARPRQRCDRARHVARRGGGLHGHGGLRRRRPQPGRASARIGALRRPGSSDDAMDHEPHAPRRGCRDRRGPLRLLRVRDRAPDRDPDHVARAAGGAGEFSPGVHRRHAVPGRGGDRRRRGFGCRDGRSAPPADDAGRLRSRIRGRLRRFRADGRSRRHGPRHGRHGDRTQGRRPRSDRCHAHHPAGDGPVLDGPDELRRVDRRNRRRRGGLPGRGDLRFRTASADGSDHRARLLLPVRGLPPVRAEQGRAGGARQAASVSGAGASPPRAARARPWRADLRSSDAARVARRRSDPQGRRPDRGRAGSCREGAARRAEMGHRPPDLSGRGGLGPLRRPHSHRSGAHEG